VYPRCDYHFVFVSLPRQRKVTQISFTHILNQITGAITSKVSVGITACIIAFNCICVFVTAVLTVLQNFPKFIQNVFGKIGISQRFSSPITCVDTYVEILRLVTLTGVWKCRVFSLHFQRLYYLHVINISNTVKKVCFCESKDFCVSLKAES